MSIVYYCFYGGIFVYGRPFSLRSWKSPTPFFGMMGIYDYEIYYNGE
jgi:hypothetical protein